MSTGFGGKARTTGQSYMNRVGVGVIDKTWTLVVGSTYEFRSKYFIVE